LSTDGNALHERFVAALDDDLDLPVALAVVREALRSDLPADEKRWLVLDADAVLGLDLHRVWDAMADAADDALSPEAERLLGERAAARAAKDYALADDLRARLFALGVEPIDSSDGPPGWRRRE
jgi:cysteinyl-tRNA synthetase